MKAHAMPRRILFANAWWHADVVNSTVRHAAERGWHLDLQTCLSGVLPDHWEGDGIITQLGGDVEQLLRLIQQADCPVVSLNSNFPEIEMPRVVVDDAVAGRMAAAHFIERGFSHCAFYAHGLSSTSAVRRCEAFEAELAESGCHSSRLFWGEARGSRENTWLARQLWLRRMLPRQPRPLGVFATNDQAAAEVIEACLSESIAVPGEVAVLGMLDMDIFRETTTVQLSSVRVDFDHLTGVACDVLERMMDGEPAPTVPLVFPPLGIVARRSTDTIAAHHPVVARALAYLFEHYTETVDMETLALAAGVGRSVLYECFQTDLRDTPGRILSRIRLERAQRLLIGGDQTVDAIAQSCGFRDRINLHRHFKRRFGVSPAAYRREHAQH